MEAYKRLHIPHHWPEAYAHRVGTMPPGRFLPGTMRRGDKTVSMVTVHFPALHWDAFAINLPEGCRIGREFRFVVGRKSENAVLQLMFWTVARSSFVLNMDPVSALVRAWLWRLGDIDSFGLVLYCRERRVFHGTFMDFRHGDREQARALLKAACLVKATNRIYGLAMGAHRQDTQAGSYRDRAYYLCEEGPPEGCFVADGVPLVAFEDWEPYLFPRTIASAHDT